MDSSFLLEVNNFPHFFSCFIVLGSLHLVIIMILSGGISCGCIVKGTTDLSEANFATSLAQEVRTSYTTFGLRWSMKIGCLIGIPMGTSIQIRALPSICR